MGGPTGRFLCAWAGNAGNIHNFQLTMEPTPGSVSVDSVWYRPTYDSPRPKGSYVVFKHDDPDVSRSGTWTTLPHGGSNATLTSTPGSSLSLVFTGLWHPSLERVPTLNLFSRHRCRCRGMESCWISGRSIRCLIFRHWGWPWRLFQARASQSSFRNNPWQNAFPNLRVQDPR